MGHKVFKCASRIALSALSVVVLGCGTVTNNPFKKPVIISFNACDTQFSRSVELDRLGFELPVFWTKLQPCEAIKVSRDIRQDDWDINAMAMFSYSDIVGLSSAASFSINPNLDILGNPYMNPQQWMALKKQAWKNLAEVKYARPKKRKVSWVRRGKLECWRVETQSFLEKSGSLNEYEISTLGISYDCWQSGDNTYPHIHLGAGVNYRNGKPIYDIDIDKALLDPVFTSLRFKQLSKADYEKRLAANQKRFRKNCRRRIASARKSGPMKLNEHARKGLIECGYDPTTLRRM